MTGYADPAYAASLSEWGEPRPLPACGGSVLVRQVSGSEASDAMGPYPLFACRDWSRIGEDVAALAGRLVALSLVTDPFAGADEATLAAAFPDLCRRFKDHYVVDLASPKISAHHRRNARKAQGELRVHELDPTDGVVEDWLRLYQVLVARRHISGPQQFSRSIFERQLGLSGMRVLAAERDGRVVGMTLWLEAGDVAYYHLGAYAEEGYALNASFALFAAAIERFRVSARWLSLGAGAGAADGEDGLTRFKRGWTSLTRPTFLCGAILDRALYARLSAGQPTRYFPAYRAGEFA